MKMVYLGGEGEIIEKKSRFIATVRTAETEEEAAAFIGEMRKKYYDARHNCYAYVIGDGQQISKCSDDGEPSQTAGRPMLDVLQKEDMHNTAVVVTRYFGGTLLGTGGLVRAYQKAVSLGLGNSVVIDRLPGVKLCIHTDYNGLGKIQYFLAGRQITIQEITYTDTVDIQAVVLDGEEQKIMAEITEQTNGSAAFSVGASVTFAKIDKDVKIFEKKG